MRVILIRHGETKGNREKRYIGRTDEPLLDPAFQAATHSARERVQNVYVSPMLRAQQTARRLFPEAELRLLEDLREMDFGAFEGKTAKELENDPEYRHWVGGGCILPCPGGDGMEGFAARVKAAFLQAVQESLLRGDDHLAIVAHGGTIMAIMAQLAYPKRSYHEFQVRNLSGYTATLDENTWEQEPALTAYEVLPALSV